jgi:hypothetical protein
MYQGRKGVPAIRSNYSTDYLAEGMR